MTLKRYSARELNFDIKFGILNIKKILKFQKKFNQHNQIFFCKTLSVGVKEHPLHKIKYEGNDFEIRQCNLTKCI